MPTLVSWNCNMAFRRKRDLLSKYDPDVLVVQECECPDTVGEWEPFADWRWIGEREHQGLAVFSADGTLSTPGVTRHGGLLTLPVVTETGPDVLAVWAKNDETTREHRYIGQVSRAVADYEAFLDGETAVLGDFNWNREFDDSPKYPLHDDLAGVIERLRAHDIHSSYHRTRDCAFGDEPEPTLYMQKKRDRPYHIDYVFLPRATFASDVTVTVGAYDDWIDASDHVPLVVEW